jgi:hypothetical protein
MTVFSFYRSINPKTSGGRGNTFWKPNIPVQWDNGFARGQKESQMKFKMGNNKWAMAGGMAMALGLGLGAQTAAAQSAPTGFVKTVMVFSKVNSHDQTMVSLLNALKAMSTAKGFTLIEAPDPNQLAYANLKSKNVQVLIWGPNEGGDPVLPEGPLQNGVQQWVEEGGGYIGIHNGNALGVRTWPWQFANVIQTYNGDTGDNVKGPLTVYDSTAPGYAQYPLPDHMKRMLNGMKKSNTFTDEWYSMFGDPRKSIALEAEPGFKKDWKTDWAAADYGLKNTWVLAYTDDGNWIKPDGGKAGASVVMGAFHPISWAHFTKKGRTIVNLALHNTQIYTQNNNWYGEMMWRNIAWAAGDPFYFDPVGIRINNRDGRDAGANPIALGEADRLGLGVEFTAAGRHDVVVVGVNGKVAFHRTGMGPASYSLSALPRGIYQLRASAGGRTISQKLVKN